MNIDKIGADTWLVQSESNPNEDYMVYNTIHEGFTCTCKWWTVHCRLRPPHPLCKHIRAVFKTFIKKKVS
jgi:hypothetical protein